LSQKQKSLKCDPAAPGLRDSMIVTAVKESPFQSLGMTLTECGQAVRAHSAAWRHAACGHLILQCGSEYADFIFSNPHIQTV